MDRERKRESLLAQYHAKMQSPEPYYVGAVCDDSGEPTGPNTRVVDNILVAVQPGRRRNPYMTRAAQVLGNVLNEHMADAKDHYRGHNARAVVASVRQARDLYAALHKHASYYDCNDFYRFDSLDAYPVASRLLELAIQAGEISPARGNELIEAVGAFWRERPSF